MSDFKARLRAGHTVSLVNTDYVSCGLIDFLGTLGADAAMFDCEQGTPGFEDVEDMTRTARLRDLTAIVRVPSVEPWTIERYMMRGVDGIVVPRLDTAAQVVQVVHDIRYAVPRTFDQKTVIVQVESTRAVDELDGFLDVSEVDCYFIGAVDLSKSMGFGGDYRHPEVMATLDTVIARIRGAGRSVGFMVKEHDLTFWQDKGVNLLYTHVNDFLSMGATAWRRLAGLAN